MSAPAGWYPDPDPQADPGSSRYWDGGSWTEHVRTEASASGPAQQQYGQDPYGSGSAYGYSAAPQAQAGPPPATSGKRTHTDDGVPLTGYGRRVGAYLLDGVLLSVLTLVVAFPWVRDLVQAYERFLDQVVASAESSGTVPDQAQLMADIAGPTTVIALIGLVMSLLYFCGFWKWKAATPGKMALGLRIRRWDAEGPLGWSHVLLRWLGLNLGSLLSVVPLVNLVAFIWPFVDLLWPLWDARRQALHDKFAGTVVVRTR